MKSGSKGPGGGGSFLFCFLVTHFFHSRQSKTVHDNNEACNALIPIQIRQFKGQGKCVAKGKEGYQTYINLHPPKQCRRGRKKVILSIASAFWQVYSYIHVTSTCTHTRSLPAPQCGTGQSERFISMPPIYRPGMYRPDR